MNVQHLQWWSNLRHSGMLLDAQRLSSLVSSLPEPLADYQQDRLRREVIAFQDNPSEQRGSFVAHVLQKVCGFALPHGNWYRAGNVAATWTRRGLTGEAIRPSHLWISKQGGNIPVFIDDQKRLGLGRGKRIVSQVLWWLRKGEEQLAILTNGQQWRVVFAGLDYEAFCEWDIDQWLAEGQTTEEFAGFRAILAPGLWMSPEEDQAPPLLAAINESRKGQADLSQVLGERVRQAAELLVRAHTAALKEHMDNLASQDIYRASVRMIMRLVVILFAESRDGLLPRDNPVYHNAYSLQGLRELLERISPHKLVDSFGAYPRILALLRLIHQGCGHEGLPVPAYGGELFAPGRSDDTDGMKRALYLFETACFGADIMTDYEVHQILELLSRTKVKIRQGRAATWMPAPVDFSSLDSEYIGILYEGLLDFELRCATEEEPVVFLAVGNQPALPLGTLEQMDDNAIKNLLEKFKDTSSDGDDEDAEELEESSEDTVLDEDVAEEAEEETTEEELAGPVSTDDARYTLQARAENWARRACEVGRLINRPRGRMMPEKQMQYERALASKSRQLVVKVVLPGEWYLVRWGGTRKGSGTFYTRPQLAIPTVHRTLRPLAYDPPLDANGQLDTNASAENWTPKKPEEILSLKVCDPACGSGSFCLASLRFLTNALYESLVIHDRISDHAGRAVLDLIYDEQSHQSLASEALPCRPDDDEFEVRTKAVLRRYVIERCIYGVDLDPLAVELCRLSLWIETLERSLPLTFLNHKIKPGNSLVGAWFNQFLHYPIMAWKREGGDKNHSNGVHYGKEARTKAIKFLLGTGRDKAVKNVKQDLLDLVESAGNLFQFIDPGEVKAGHDTAEATLKEIHELGIAQIDQRAAKYEALRASPEFIRLKGAFDLWCALWFWPADRLEYAPLPTQFAAGEIGETDLEIIRQVADRQRFFHWELEFPDVFNASSHGFDAILGNPPWDIAKPISKEFFSAYDPLYRGYGNQDALRKQTDYFEQDASLEGQWLDYIAFFKAMGNWVKYAGFPFGDRITTKDVKGTIKQEHDFKFKTGFDRNQVFHTKWKQQRERTSGYADVHHSFRHQGSADINLYKLFLEQAHALLADHGRLGLIVPSGLYSDFGTGELRRLFVDECSWEWLFGFENREKIFDIDSRFKFNPVIVAKGGRTQAIRTAFMRRDLADWEKGEQFVTDYAREQVLQFSPKSRAILEIQSQRDLEVLTKIYANSVLLGDQSEEGWGIKYATEFHMTNDSKLFPPRPKWEEWGYQPDEYSRWIKGPWKPIEQLWSQLGVEASAPVSINPTCAQRIEAGITSGEVGKTGWTVRCAQPPYDKLPISRADIPAGIILSREATHYIHEDDIPTVTFTDASGKPLKIKTRDAEGNKVTIEPTGPAITLPLYEGRMIGQFDFSEKGWVSGKGRGAVWKAVGWEQKVIEPQFLMGQAVYCISIASWQDFKLGIMDVTSSTNARTMISTPLGVAPTGHKVPTLAPLVPYRSQTVLQLGALANSFTFDYLLRNRFGALSLIWAVIEENAIPNHQDIPECLAHLTSRLICSEFLALPELLKLCSRSESRAIDVFAALTRHERIRLRCIIEAIVAGTYRLDIDANTHVFESCDYPCSLLSDNSFSRHLNPKAFWRIDKSELPEHRLPILSLVAFRDLQEKIDAYDDDMAAGIEAFCNQNGGEGWMLPETLRLADYSLGHDDRAGEYQPVRECFGPRFYDWQLAQSPEESWRECQVHARNLLGEEGYQRLLAEIGGDDGGPDTDQPGEEPAAPKGMLFDTSDMPLFRRKEEDV
ncbi:Eco57I restriction-modification methylase domain-containing protein [Planctomycetota bacterium]